MPDVKTGVSLTERINELMGNEKELIVLKGKLYSPTEEHKQETGEVYYTFRLKVIKNINDDEYGKNYNTYICIMPCDVSHKFSKQQIQDMKNNEVLALCSARAGVRTFMRKDTDEQVAVNNITLYVVELLNTRRINVEMAGAKSYKL